MILDYVLRSHEIVILFVLVYSWHDIQNIDLEFLEVLGENRVPFALIFTKSDKQGPNVLKACLLYTSDAADDLLCVDLGGRRIIKKKNVRML